MFLKENQKDTCFSYETQDTYVILINVIDYSEIVQSKCSINAK